MADHLLFLAAACCWIAAFAILAARQRVLARKVQRLRLRVDKLAAPRPDRHVTVIGDGRFTHDQVTAFARRAQRAGG